MALNLHTLILTKNDCYKQGKKITPKGFMLHSTGANNPWLKRYVGPDDGLLGKNQYGNHWNQGGIEKCVHAFIGKLADGSIATYQTLPWDMRGWHAGSGSKGSANNTHISCEICEDNLKDPVYFAAVYREAVELVAMLCRQYGFTEKNVIDHSEGHKLGVASNHGDVAHWFPKHGKSMSTFREDVKKLLATAEAPATPPAVQPPEQQDDAVLPEAYRVQSGDTWWSLAKRWLGKGSRYPELQIIYGTTKLIAGEMLCRAIEPPAIVIPDAVPDTYKVQSGDTWWALAKRWLGSGAKYPQLQTYYGTKKLIAGAVLKLVYPRA